MLLRIVTFQYGRSSGLAPAEPICFLAPYKGHGMTLTELITSQLLDPFRIGLLVAPSVATAYNTAGTVRDRHRS